MKLPYYEDHFLRQVEVTQCCPGCGRIDKLTVRSQVNSYVHNTTEYYIECNCGWLGPTAMSPIIAAVKWEARAMIIDLSEVRV